MPQQKKKVCREIVTIGLPLPNLLEYTADVCFETRGCLDALKRYSEQRGIKTHEIKERGINVASNHANLVSNMIGDWILFCGSDHTFSPALLDELLRATEQPPYPKIIGAVCNYRGAPYRWTFAKFDESGERLFPLVPYYNCDPAMMSSAEIQEVDVMGSGVTLYHRSVFDKVPPPWFTYEPRRPGMPEIEKVLRDWDDDTRFDEWLEGLAEGPETFNMTGADAVRLREKAKGLRGMLAKFRRPASIGMDFQICLRAKDYGIKSYVHWGVVTHHLTLEHTHPQRYVHWLESDRNNWTAEVMARDDLTFENIAKIRHLTENADKQRLEWEREVAASQEAEMKKTEENDEDSSEGKKVASGGLDGQSAGDTQVERTRIEGPEEVGAY